MNSYAATPLMTLFRIVICTSGSNFKDQAQLLQQALEGIISYAKTNAIVTRSSDIVETAKTLSKEVRRQIGNGHPDSYMTSKTVPTPWVSSTLAHIVQSDRSSASRVTWASTGLDRIHSRTLSTTHTEKAPFQVSMQMGATSDIIENLVLAPSVHSDEGYGPSPISMLPADLQAELSAMSSSQAIRPLSATQGSSNPGYLADAGMGMGMMISFEQGPSADLNWDGFYLEQ